MLSRGVINSKKRYVCKRWCGSFDLIPSRETYVEVPFPFFGVSLTGSVTRVTRVHSCDVEQYSTCQAIAAPFLLLVVRIVGLWDHCFRISSSPNTINPKPKANSGLSFKAAKTNEAMATSFVRVSVGVWGDLRFGIFIFFASNYAC
jgi:hypothetical protein